MDKKPTVEPFDQNPSAQRIKRIIDRYNRLTLSKEPKDDEVLQAEAHRLVHTLEVEDGAYNNVQLLNDLYHIKYDCHVVDDCAQFQAFFEFLQGEEQRLQCDVRDCFSVKRYYSRRGRAGDAMALSIAEGAFSLYLICRMHAFFVYQYDLSRLTPKEIQVIEDKISDVHREKKMDQEEKDEMKQEMISEQLRIKRQKTQHILGVDEKDNINDRLVSQGVDRSINVEKLHDIMVKHIGGCLFIDVENALLKYECDEPKMLSDVCDLMMDVNAGNALSQMLMVEFECTELPKRLRIYDDVLYSYFTVGDLDHANFLKILKVTTPHVVPNADCDELAKVAVKHQMCGKIFVPKDAEGKKLKTFMNHAKFALMFEGKCTDWKKQHYMNIHKKIKRWKSPKPKRKASASKPQLGQSVSNEVPVQMVLPEVDDDEKKGGDDDDDDDDRKNPNEEDDDDRMYGRNTKEGRSIIRFCEMTDENDEFVAAKYLEPAQWSVVLAIEEYYKRTAAERIADSGLEVSGKVYSHGIAFWYWGGQDKVWGGEDDKKYMIKFVTPNHNTMKEEVMATKHVNARNWRGLMAQCKALIQTDAMRKKKTNGNEEDCRAYGIAEDSAITLQHLIAIRLYTDFSGLCYKFCDAFRKKNPLETIAATMRRNQKIGHWARLLIELIRCYGKVYPETKQFYRGITSEFLFKRFMTRFNGPVSTSTNLDKAIGFSTGGLVMELRSCSHLDFNPGLDCAFFGSEFDEKEVLFFSAVFKINTIKHALGSKWFNYKKPITHIRAIQRIAEGGMEWENRNNYQDIFNILLPEQYGYAESPAQFKTEYALKLIEYHFKAENLPQVIEYDFFELAQSYEWVKTIFVKGKDIPNLANMCNLFRNVNLFKLRMPDSVTMNKQFCEAMMEEMLQIANLGAVQIEFEWSRNCTKAFNKIEETLMACAEASENIALDVKVREVAGQPKSVKIIPSKKVVVEEEKKEEEEKTIKGSDERIGSKEAFPIIYDSITLSFIEFFAFHGDPYWKYEPINYAKMNNPRLIDHMHEMDETQQQKLQAIMAKSSAERTWPEGTMRHPFFKHPLRADSDVSPEITKAIYRAIGEKERQWSVGFKGEDTYQEHTVGELTTKDIEPKPERDNCTWDMKLMELKCHKEIMIPRQQDRERGIEQQK